MLLQKAIPGACCSSGSYQGQGVLRRTPQEKSGTIREAELECRGCRRLSLKDASVAFQGKWELAKQEPKLLHYLFEQERSSVARRCWYCNGISMCFWMITGSAWILQGSAINLKALRQDVIETKRGLGYLLWIYRTHLKDRALVYLGRILCILLLSFYLLSVRILTVG